MSIRTCLTCEHARTRDFGKGPEPVRCGVYQEDDVNGTTSLEAVMHGEEWMCPLDTTVVQRFREKQTRITR